MFIEKEISIFDFVCAISKSIDLVSVNLTNHHREVAYISCQIAQRMNLPDDEVRDIVLAAILHDIGAFTTEERTNIIRCKLHDQELNRHAELGYKLLKNFEPLNRAALLIRHHHDDYDESNPDIPLGSYIIHLADRTAGLLDERRDILEQVPSIMSIIQDQRKHFHPGAVAALHHLASLEYFWIETISFSIEDILPRRMKFSKEIIYLETLRSFAKITAQIIDFRSRFTATHSSGVAAVALELSNIFGFSERECSMMEIAGFMHDLGKLSVSNDILEKNGALDPEEFNSIRKHTYYTYAILAKITGLEQVAEWAAYHHEKLDGSGYPFHVKGRDYSKMARIMAVADIFTAVTEDRPYRVGMNEEKTVSILEGMVGSGAIDRDVVQATKDNFIRINESRKRAQHEAQREYKEFHG